MWWLYIIEKKGKYYTGITTDLQNRLRQHGNPPLLFKKTFPDKIKAVQLEKEYKGYSRLKKEKLFAKFSQ